MYIYICIDICIDIYISISIHQQATLDYLEGHPPIVSPNTPGNPCITHVTLNPNPQIGLGFRVELPCCIGGVVVMDSLKP